jgi:hypothetical protein
LKEQLSLPGFPDEPGFFDSLETWEQFLAEVEAMPHSVQKPQIVLHAEHMIALKKEELAPMPSNLPLIVAFIDGPGPFGNNYRNGRSFWPKWSNCPTLSKSAKPSTKPGK